ncbi:MAG: mycothiol synthase [Microbacteriaceae bacterium]
MPPPSPPERPPERPRPERSRPEPPGWLPDLVESARAADGVPPFSDRALVEARTGVRALVTLGDIAAAIVTDAEAELVVHPEARRRGHGTALLDAVLETARPGLLVWAHGDLPGARALAVRRGFRTVRTLRQLRAAVPPDAVPPDAVPPDAGGLRLRPFRPGEDEDAWLELNRRAFAAHPEQGRLGAAELAELEREPWFDAGTFLLGWERGALAGCCWLKIDPAEPGIGEVYVMAVDPARQGAGLGGALLEAGLALLARRGIRTAALYVEADNATALALYRRAGFLERSADVQYRWDG